MLDSIYKTVQGILNKQQLGYLKPIHYNSFINTAIMLIYNTLLTDLKSNVRKSNWMLDGKNLADLSKHSQQLVEYFLFETPALATPFTVPTDCEFIENVYFGNTEIDKLEYPDFRLIQRNNYVPPSECSPKCTLVGRNLKITPDSIRSIAVTYLRSPKRAKYTYTEYEGKPMYDPTSNSFVDVDLPTLFEPKLVSLVTEMASKHLRQLGMVQLENQDQAQKVQQENRQ